uniref:Uncharacterized protein P0552F09.119 n=2 Tax=Oryza sativa subsp. japonica TaxID=39947 RepID=Q7X7Z5_ORYSJ|nr:hypothetical protein [Oryza sativa Japonica Group]BAC79994.1 hypothetical protein [Oryza sativa Japonica Group]
MQTAKARGGRLWLWKKVWFPLTQRLAGRGTQHGNAGSQSRGQNPCGDITVSSSAHSEDNPTVSVIQQ